ncbi:MAG: glycosyltransferase [Litoreibacter sp.]|nr:glycosyltransferase [Litoreibacter sp.]
MIELSIIIPHLNDVVRLRRCLDALAAQVSAAVETIVVDNGSDMDLGPVARDFPWAFFLSTAERGAGPARNKGVEAAKGQRLAFLDCDCVPSSGWVARILSMSGTDQVVGGCVGTFDEGHSSFSSAQLFERVFAFDNARYIADLGFSVTANLVTTRAVFDKVGPFRTGLPEDVDWCTRARIEGFRISYDPELVVQHPTREDWRALCRKYRRVEEERFAFRDEGPIIWLIRAFLTGLSPLRDTMKVMKSSRLSGTGERLRCLIALYRLRLRRMRWMIQFLFRFRRRPARS